MSRPTSVVSLLQPVVDLYGEYMGRPPGFRGDDDAYETDEAVDISEAKAEMGWLGGDSGRIH